MKLIILTILIVGLFLISGCVIKEPVENQEIVCEECPEEQALVFEIFDSWGENVEKEDQYLFGVSLINFGFVEAKDVEVTCYIDDVDLRIFEDKKVVGGLASKSITYKELSFDVDLPRNVETSRGYCYISSCSNCIILGERITELKELRE